MDAPVIAVEHVRKTYGTRVAVDGVSLAIHAGECFGLVGPNGAGKTSTILMACGLLRPDEGTVTLGPDAIPVSRPAARRMIGYVPQEIALYDDLSALENLLFFGRLYGLGRAARHARAQEALGAVGLRERARDRVSTFSGGMQRRLNIAAALLHEPPLLVLDEPTAGVDPQSRNLILEGITRLREAGTAVLYTTHHLEEVERVCTRIGIIDEGSLLAGGTRESLLAGEGGAEHIRLSCPEIPPALPAKIAALDGVASAVYADGRLEIDVTGAPAVLPPLLALCAGEKVDVTGVTVDRPRLEDVFLKLTGKALRDG